VNLSDLSLFYSNLSQMQSAGVGLVSFFQSLRDSEKNEDRKRIFNLIAENLKKGRPLASTLKNSGLLPVFDIPIIEGGEKSGTLTRSCDILAKNYEISAEAAKTVRGGLLKPFFVFAAALFLPSFPDLFLGKITLAAYLTKSLGILAVVTFIFWFLYKLFMASYFSLEAARTRHRIMLLIPFVRDVAKKMALEKFCSSLSIMLEAGLPITDAISMAGQASAETEISMASQRIVKKIKAGEPLPRTFKSEKIFTDDIQNTITLGNESGKIPAFLDRSAQSLKKDINRGIEKISKAIPAIIYWIVVLYVAWTIVGFYTDRMKSLNDVIGTGL
jgi:type II secretory pathway component PulF